MNRRELLILTAAAGVVAVAHPSWALSDSGFSYKKSRFAVLGHEMAFVDAGNGDPVVFLHGNPTSSYLWRNILPVIQKTHRVIAPDLIGMGDSDKPDIGYTYRDHVDHLHGLLDALDLQNATLVVHDWGSALGLDWATKNEGRVKGVAFMEAILPPGAPAPNYKAIGPFGDLFKAWRTPGVGEKMILEDNFFINEVLAKMGVATPLSDDVLARYNSYYPTTASRRPLLQWPREVPIGGVPAHSVAAVKRYSRWFFESDIPKLMIHAEPGALIPLAAAKYLKANLKNLTTVNIGAGVHYLQEDNPDAISLALKDWLETL
jgi:haloalkane dehalogenase